VKNFLTSNARYTVRVSEPDPKLATLFLEQFGGPQGELAAAMRYFTRALAEEDAGRKDMLYDIATEEMSHLEIIGSIFCMLNKGVKGKLAEGVGEATELLAEITQGGESHTTSILYGAAPPWSTRPACPGRRPTWIRSAIRPVICARTSRRSSARKSFTSV
jgi:Mn-containing catalase